MADPESSTSAKSPSFQFYPNDFSSGTLTLSTEEVGAYILLMCHCWDKGHIPTDLKLLARIAKLPPARMRKVWESLRPKFQPIDDGLIQPRIERERMKQAEFRRKQRENGSRRWVGTEAKATRSQRLTKARKLGTHTEEEWESLKSQYNGCVRCGAVGVEIVRDHIIPIYQGGSDAIDNIQPLCIQCNSSKGPDRTNYTLTAKRLPSAGQSTADAEPNASSSSSVFGFQSSEKHTQTRAREKTDLPQRAGAFVQWYEDTHQRLFQIGYIGAQRDYQSALQLCEKLTDQQVRDAALVWFGMDDDFATSGTRTITKFASRASGCLQQARQQGIA